MQELSSNSSSSLKSCVAGSLLLAASLAPCCAVPRYGVAIGSTLAPLVRVLMLLCAPISWPLSKLLDVVLGHETVAMKRQQLKAMVQLHGEGAGG
jgi:metal transporter CNNM